MCPGGGSGGDSVDRPASVRPSTDDTEPEWNCGRHPAVHSLHVGPANWTLFASVLSPSESTVQALAATFTPSLEDDQARLRRIYSNFMYVFGDMPSDTQTKLALLIRLIEGASWLRYGRSLSSLPSDRRETLCHTIADAPIGRIQAGFAGLRSLVLNATYTEPVMWDGIGYAGPTVDADTHSSRESVSPPRRDLGSKGS